MIKSVDASKKLARVAVPFLAAAAVTAALLPAGAQANADSVGASAVFTKGDLIVTAPTSAVSFGNTQLDGRASYDLSGDVGDWLVNDASGDLSGWSVTVEASEPTAADTGTPATGAVMTMKAPATSGVGPAPAPAPGDVNGFSRLNTAGGAALVNATPGKGVGQWQLRQTGGGDLKLVMPYDTRGVQYDSTITFTTAPAIS
jgi:hypothetical protein